MKTRILILITLLCAATASLESARATTITVTNINDSGAGSLRQALADANDSDTINFDSSLKGQKITLTSGQLNVDKDVTITGLGSNNLAVDGNGQSVVFSINPGKTVTIQGLTVENGTIGIYNIDATLTVSNCIVSGNSGTGIINSGGFRNGATLTIANCTVSGNFDGGIANAAAVGSATVTITESTVSGNSGAWGGGIANLNTGQMAGVLAIVSNSTVSGNSADFGGGGIFNGASVGGVAAVTVSNSTLSGNSASEGGGGIYNQYAGGSTTLEIDSTILNASSSGENIFNDGGTVTSDGYNLSSDDGGGYLNGPGDQINLDPLLGPLRDNGGATFTHTLLPGSPAINAGDPSFTPPPFYDQRGLGFDRVANGRIDIGSFEAQTQIDLQASGRKVRGINTVRLTWSGATSVNIDVYRNGSPIVTTGDDGLYRDSTGDTGRARYMYRVCEAGTETCSNNARVTFPQ